MWPFPKDPVKLLVKAEQLEREQRYEDAIALYTKVLKRDPHNARVWFSKALALEAIAQVMMKHKRSPISYLGLPTCHPLP